MITLEEFRKLELRVGRILEVQDHPHADKLYILTVETGGTQKRVVAGIRRYYPKEALRDKFCILVDNLQPTTIRGVESQGMLLAAKDAKDLAIVTIEKEIAPGSPVT